MHIVLYAMQTFWNTEIRRKKSKLKKTTNLMTFCACSLLGISNWIVAIATLLLMIDEIFRVRDVRREDKEKERDRNKHAELRCGFSIHGI